MRTKPLELKLYSLVLFLIALSFPIQIAILYHHSIFEYDLVLGKLAPLNWIVISLSLFTAWLIFTASAWSYIFSFILCYFMVRNNIFVSELGNDYSLTSTAAASSLFFIFISILFTSKFRNYILNEEIRWWLAPKRFSTRLKTSIEGNGLARLDAHTHDISETGIFLAHPNLVQVATRKDYRLKISITEKWTIDCSGEVIRTAEGNGRYPDGAGIRLYRLKIKDRIALKWMMIFLGKER